MIELKRGNGRPFKLTWWGEESGYFEIFGTCPSGGGISNGQSLTEGSIVNNTYLCTHFTMPCRPHFLSDTITTTIPPKGEHQNQIHTSKGPKTLLLDIDIHSIHINTHTARYFYYTIAICPCGGRFPPPRLPTRPLCCPSLGLWSQPH